MFRNATLVLAITLVLGSLSVARAEDPDQDFIEHLNAAGLANEASHAHDGRNIHRIQHDMELTSIVQCPLKHCCSSPR